MGVYVNNISAVDALTISYLIFSAVLDDLTEEGKEQLKAFGEMLSDEAVEAITRAGEDISEYIRIASDDTT